MLQSLLLLQNTSDPESMMFLDNSSPSFSAQQLQLTEEEVDHDAKTFCLQAPSLIFEPFFTMSRDDQLGKAITHVKRVFAIGSSQTVYDCLRRCYVYMEIRFLGSLRSDDGGSLRRSL